MVVALPIGGKPPERPSPRRRGAGAEVAARPGSFGRRMGAFATGASREQILLQTTLP